MPPVVFIVTADWSRGVRIQWMLRALRPCAVFVVDCDQVEALASQLRPDLFVVVADTVGPGEATALARSLAKARPTPVIVGVGRSGTGTASAVVRAVGTTSLLLSGCEPARLARDADRMLQLESFRRFVGSRPRAQSAGGTRSIDPEISTEHPPR